MSLLIASISITAAAIYWYMNRNKPIRHIISELRSNIDIHGAGVAGLIDDWWNKARNNIELPDAKKNIAIVTGGARGIGTEVVRGLLKANMIVIIGIRKPKLAEKLAKDMENGDNLQAIELDLQSLRSVRAFAEAVLKQYPKIHLLVNNAGIMFGDYKLTEDGIETQLAVNHIGHFYLTHLLLPALKMGGASGQYSRVVNVTSCAHHPGTINFEDINMKNHYDTRAAYSQSKLAGLMSARFINQIMEEECCPVRCYSVHPGIVNTDLFEDTAFRKYIPWAMNLCFKTPAKGATSILYACFEKSLDKQGGLYISNCREGISNSFSKKFENQKRLHKISCDLTKISMENYGV